MARNTKKKNTQKSAKCGNAEKRKPQTKKTNTSRGKGATPTLAARSNNVVKESSSPSKSTTGANKLRQQAAPKNGAVIEQNENKKIFPKRFPFWARLKIAKNRTTLVIDEEPVKDKRTNKTEDGFVHREATHTTGKDYEKIDPNPDRADPKPMYLKRPKKAPKRLFKPHNKDLDMPEDLRKRYDGNNDKKE